MPSPVREVVVVGRDPARTDALVARTHALGMDARVGTPSGVSTADLVCTCTTSAVSVFSGHELQEGVHINAIGAYLADQRELDTEAMRRSKVVVETRDMALREAGDVVMAIDEGALDPEALVDLPEVVQGRSVRTEPSDITAFVSVGFAFEISSSARRAAGALLTGKCRERGSNPHACGHGILSPARLPVPPSRPGTRAYKQGKATGLPAALPGRAWA